MKDYPYLFEYPIKNIMDKLQQDYKPKDDEILKNMLGNGDLEGLMTVKQVN